VTHFPSLADALHELSAIAAQPRRSMSLRALAPVSRGFESELARRVRQGDQTALPTLRSAVQAALHVLVTEDPSHETWRAAYTELTTPGTGLLSALDRADPDGELGEIAHRLTGRTYGTAEWRWAAALVRRMEEEP